MSDHKHEHDASIRHPEPPEHLTALNPVRCHACDGVGGSTATSDRGPQWHRCKTCGGWGWVGGDANQA